VVIAGAGFAGFNALAGAVPAGREDDRDRGDQFDRLLPVPSADAAGGRRADRAEVHPRFAAPRQGRLVARNVAASLGRGTRQEYKHDDLGFLGGMGGMGGMAAGANP
jgi:hypothetical protein